MSDKGEKTCPLCAEEMDLTDQQLKPCKCGYEICVWCWNHIMEMAEKDNTEGRCPACRLPYDKEKIVGMAANCERLVAEINSERKQKPQKAKPKAPEGRMHLINVRVIKRNLVYVIGLPLDLADEDLLQRKEYFGQYGKVLKVSISRTANGVIQHSANNSCCVYVTYSKEEEAVCCIQSVHSFVLEGKPLRACFGTTKYCHAWLRNAPCNIPDCLYLHGFGSQEDSFTKDEIVSAFSRSKMQQTIGASINLHRRSGNVLPPPLPEYTSNGISSSAKPVAKTHPNNVGNENKESCVDGGTGNSTALPAAASWVKRVSASLSPVPNMSASGTISNNHPDAYAGPHIPSEVVSTKKSTNDMKRTLIAEESSEIHPDCRTDSLEFKEYPDSNYKTCTSNRKADALSNTSSAPVTCGEPDTVASKVTGVAAPINIERSINYCSRSSYSSGSDDENSNTDGDFQGLSSICNLSHTKIKELAPVHDSSFSTHTSLGLPRGLSSQGDINEQSYRGPSLPVQNKSMTSKDLLDFEDKQLRSLEDICNLPSASFSDSLQQNSNGLSYNSWQKGEVKHQNELLAHSRILPVHEKVSFPMTYENLVSSNGFHNDLDGNVGDLDRSFDYSSMSGLANNKGVNNAVSLENYTPDVGEDRIISKILSMELDPWEDSLTSPDSLSKLLRETKEQRGSLKPPSLRKATDNNQSRFSFARQEGFSNQASDFDDSVGSIMDFNKFSAHHNDYNAINDLCIDNYQNPCSLYSSQEPSNLLNNHNFASSKLSVSKPPASIPPGFSAPSRAPPPGFSTSGRMNLALDSAASHLLQTSEPQVKNGSIGEVGFLDPAILEVGQGLMAMGLNKSGFDTRTSASHHSSFDHKPGFNTRASAPQHSSFDHDTRLQLAMQQSLYEHQNLGFQDHSRNRLSQSNDTYGMSPTLLDQSPAYNPFSFPQSTTQQLRNAHLPNGHGGSWNDARSYNDLRLPELLKNGGLGFSTFTPTYEDLKCQMSSSSNLYNRGFAM